MSMVNGFYIRANERKNLQKWPIWFGKVSAIALIVASSLLMPQGAYASLDQDLGNFWTQLGYEGNSTQSHAYEGQEAGYYSGGALFLRNHVRDLSLVHINLPSFSGGCAGIDAYLGGFSFINVDQIKTLTEKIMSSAIGYMFELALTTAVPELNYVKNHVMDLINKINAMNINSCEAAQDLVGGLWPKTQGAQQQICKDIGNHNGWFADWADARQQCGTGGEFDKTIDKASQDPNYGPEVVANTNLIWETLSNNPFLSGSDELKEFLMSLTGTIIFADKSSVHYLEGLADNQGVIKALLYGGQATIYRCDETKSCLNPTSSSATISEAHGLVNQVSLMIEGLIQSAVTDSPITEQQKGFINASPMPVLKFITVFLSSGMPTQAEELTQYSETIAESILAEYLTENIELIETNLKTKDYPDAVEQKLTQRIIDAKRIIQAMQSNANRTLTDALALERNVAYIEKQVTASLADQAQSPQNQANQ